MDYRIYYPKDTYPDFDCYFNCETISNNIINTKMKEKKKKKQKKRRYKKRVNMEPRKMDIVGGVISYTYLGLYIIGVIYLLMRMLTI